MFRPTESLIMTVACTPSNLHYNLVHDEQYGDHNKEEEAVLGDSSEMMYPSFPLDSLKYLYDTSKISM